MREVRIDPDESPGIWFSLAASAAANAGQQEDAILNVAATVVADPMNPDHHVASALSNYSQGGVDLRFAAQALGILAPRITNTWMLFGLAEATDVGDKKFYGLSTGSFILAIKLSRNPDCIGLYRNMPVTLF